MSSVLINLGISYRDMGYPDPPPPSLMGPHFSIHLINILLFILFFQGLLDFGIAYPLKIAEINSFKSELCKLIIIRSIRFVLVFLAILILYTVHCIYF